MTEELLEEVKLCVEVEQEKRKKINEQIKRIKELESNPEVEEYIKLRGLFKNKQSELDIDEDYVYFHAFDMCRHKAEISETCGIYMFLSEGKYLKGLKRQKYRLYRNIESLEEVIITESQIEEFENNHVIINNEVGLFDAQTEFVKNAVKASQKEATKIMKKKYGSKK